MKYELNEHNLNELRKNIERNTLHYSWYDEHKIAEIDKYGENLTLAELKQIVDESIEKYGEDKPVTYENYINSLGEDDDIVGLIVEIFDIEKRKKDIDNIFKETVKLLEKIIKEIKRNSDMCEVMENSLIKIRNSGTDQYTISLIEKGIKDLKEDIERCKIKFEQEIKAH